MSLMNENELNLRNWKMINEVKRSITKNLLYNPIVKYIPVKTKMTIRPRSNFDKPLFA